MYTPIKKEADQYESAFFETQIINYFCKASATQAFTVLETT